MAILGDTKATSLVVSGTSTLASINANSTGLGTNGQILKSTGTGIAWTDAASSHTHDQYVLEAGDTMTGALNIKRTTSSSLAIDNNLKIGATRYDLNFNIDNGTGSGINNGNVSAITWGKDAATYAGIYYQSSSSYGSRLIFGTTNSYSNGAYARMIILQNGRVGIGTLEPSTMLDVDGTGKFKGISSTNAINIEHSNSANLTAKDTTSTGEVFYGFGAGHQNHGIYSYGYAPTATTWTTDKKWMVCRDSTGKITLNGNAATATKLETTRTLTIGSSGKTFDGSADVSWTLDDIGAVSTSGGTMTGGLTFSSGSGAYNEKGIMFTHGSRIGENGGGSLGIYAAENIYIKPYSPTESSNTEGIMITANGLYPCVDNTELLGLSDKKWSNVYATTFTGNLKGVSNAGIYLTSSTAAATPAKTVIYAGFSLLTGSSIYIKFDKTNTVAEPTLNVNGAGAKAIYYRGVRVQYQGLAKDILYHMIYDGTNWQIVNNIIPRMGTCSTGAATSMKVVTCPGFIPYVGATVKIKFTVTNTSLTPTLKINTTVDNDAKPINWIGATNDLTHRLLDDHIYEFVYDGTKYNIVAPTVRHYATSGAAAVLYTQQDYDDYVAANGNAPTWAVGDTKTNAVEGSETIAIGNSISATENGGLRGKLIMYGTGDNYTTIMSQPNGNRNIYLPHYGGTMYLVHAGNNNAIGTSTKPVYVAANGRVSPCSTIGSVTDEVWSVNFS